MPKNSEVTMSEEEKISIQETEERRKYLYDVVVVFSGGLQKTRDKFYPTDYRHGDQFGMLGGGMRIASAVGLYLEGKAQNFVFTTGRSEKDKKAHGPDVPTQARIHEEAFLRRLEKLKRRSGYKNKFKDLEKPSTFLDEKSVSTLANIQEALKLIRKKGWRRIAFLSSDYHIPRIAALTRQLLEQGGDLKVDIDFISAEKAVGEMALGRYDRVIEKAYKSQAAQKRIASEKRGLQDIKAGRYAPGEFQLQKK